MSGYAPSSCKVRGKNSPSPYSPSYYSPSFGRSRSRSRSSYWMLAEVSATPVEKIRKNLLRKGEGSVKVDAKYLAKSHK